MELDKVAAVLRRRSGIQAVDLGTLLGRRFWTAIILPWLVMVVPVLIIVQTTVFLLSTSILLALFVGWWLKPLFDRITLYVISRGFFGSTPSTRETVRAVCDQWVSREALWDLTIRRFSPFRTMVMPVRVLEGNRGSMVTSRVRSLLDGEAQSHGLVLMGFAILFKAMMYLSLVALLLMVTPSEFVEDWFMPAEFVFFDAPLWLTGLVCIGGTTLVTVAVEPFFGAGGFGIYIQRRIEREGWDLELRFRQLADRLEQALDGLAGVFLAVLMVSLLAMMGISEPVVAQEVDEGGIWDDEQVAQQVAGPVTETAAVNRELIPVADPDEELQAILNAPPFGGRTDTVKEWRKKQPDVDDSDNRWEPGPFMKALSNLMASGFRVTMWLVMIALLLFMGWKIYRYLENRRGGPKASPERSRWEEEILSQGQELEELPDDIATAARRSWEQGAHRQALAMLLLSSLLRFEERHSYRFPPGWTTARCARTVASKGREGPVLAEVARVFGQLAWAQKEISDEQFESLLGRWNGVFGQPGGIR